MGKADIGILVAFRLKPHLRPRERTGLFRRLYGYVDQSQFGRYRYEREGVMSAIPHVRLIRGAMILREQDAPAVEEFLRPVADIHRRRVFLTPEDQEQLAPKKPRM